MPSGSARARRLSREGARAFGKRLTRLRTLVTYGHAPSVRARSDARRKSGAPVNAGWLHAAR